MRAAWGGIGGGRGEEVRAAGNHQVRAVHHKNDMYIGGSAVQQ